MLSVGHQRFLKMKIKLKVIASELFLVVVMIMLKFGGFLLKYLLFRYVK